MVWNRLIGWFRRKYSGTSASCTRVESLLPRHVEAHESITRFIYSAHHFAATLGRVKSPAIAPSLNKTSGRLEASVYRADGLLPTALWAICAAHVDDQANNRVMKARGTCKAEAMLSCALSLEADGMPHARHANLIGWPVPKHAWKNIQQKIADAMSLEIRPETQPPRT